MLVVLTLMCWYVSIGISIRKRKLIVSIKILQPLKSQEMAE